MRIKKELTELIQANDIKNLLVYTEMEYGPYNPGQYLYNLIFENSFDEKFDEKFIELVYTTLIAWNMDQRGAKLSEFNLFKDSLMDHQKEIQSLKEFRLEEIKEKDIDDCIREHIRTLFENLKLVDKDKPKLVTFSKTLHYFLPNLLMPIDRAYTLKFFYNNHNFKKTNDEQIQIYIDIFKQFRKFAVEHNCINYMDCGKRWNKNIPKMIDNMIIAYVKLYKNDKYKNDKPLTDSQLSEYFNYLNTGDKDSAREYFRKHSEENYTDEWKQKVEKLKLKKGIEVDKE